MRLPLTFFGLNRLPVLCTLKISKGMNELTDWSAKSQPYSATQKKNEAAILL